MMTPPIACVASQERMPDWDWVQSNCRAKNPVIRKKEDELRLDSWIQIRSTGWDKRKGSSLMLLARRLPAFHCRTLKESGGEEAGGVEGQPGARDGGEGTEGGDIK